MHRGTGLRQALEGLSMCGTGLNTELWYGDGNMYRVLFKLYASPDIIDVKNFEALVSGCVNFHSHLNVKIYAVLVLDFLIYLTL